MTVDDLINQTVAAVLPSIAIALDGAFKLRVKVHLNLANSNGAEIEDIPDVVVKAVASGCDDLYVALRRISEHERAVAITEALNGGRHES